MSLIGWLFIIAGLTEPNFFYICVGIYFLVLAEEDEETIE